MDSSAELRPHRAPRSIGVALVVTTLLLGACGGDDDANDAADDEGTEAGDPGVEPATIDVAVPSDLPAFAQLYVADEKGYYEDENLEVNIQAVGGGNIVSSLLSESVDLAFIGTGLCLTIENQGADCSIVYNTLGGGAGAFLAARPDITDVADCETIGALGPGSAAYGWAVNYADEAGIDPDIVPLQDTATIAAALDGGQISCGVGDFFGFARLIDEDRVNVLVDTREEDQRPSFIPSTFPEAGLFGIAEHLDGEREAIVRFLRAFHRAYTDTMSQAPAAEIAGLLREREAFQVLDEAAIVGQVEANLPFYVPSGGDIADDQWADALDVFASQGLDFVDPDDERWSYDNLVDMSYYDEATDGA